ncbi:MAG: adenylate/guanylate cyclase domain-containing protein [Fimbriimonadales bacterium]|nr:adenylate/guanylate cyclase domain-containing protein [Fimbriimonadales bacterium]
MTSSAGSPSAGLLQLAEHLRMHPEAIHADPERLAERFQLPIDLVRSALNGVRGSLSEASEREAAAPGPLRTVPEALCRVVFGPAARWLHDLWIRATEKPLGLIAGSTVFGLLGGVLSELPGGVAMTTGADVRLRGGGIVVLLGVVLTAQMACLARHGMVRLALFGGLLNWVLISTYAITSIWYRHHTGPDSERNIVPELVLLTLALLIFAALYGAIGAVVSVLGAYSRLRRAERRRERLSRQELLERMFEIEERLRAGPEVSASPRSLLEQPWVPEVRRRLLPLSLAVGAALGLGFLAATATLETASQSAPGVTGSEVLNVAVTLVFVAAWLLGQTSIAFLAGRFSRALAPCLGFALASELPEMLPWAGHGPDAFLAEFYPEKAAALIVSVAIAAIGSLGAVVEERGRRERLLRENDPAALLTELLEIQRLLAPSRSNVCILVVDVAKSSAMKANADPYIVEYTFREYQSLVRECCDAFGGTIHSTAGDGAVAGFPSAAQALAAAKRIQTRIAEFNRRTNRLAAPFRLRIGLHQGRVVGELSEVQFAEVIDIAAHVEEVAPVGGIAVTETVAQDLEGEALAELKQPVDGHRVLVVLNPTEDA